MRLAKQEPIGSRPTSAQLVNAAQQADPRDMSTQVVKLLVGKPKTLTWEGKHDVKSSIRRAPVDGPLVVGKDHVDGNDFANTKLHGRPDRVLYAIGKTQADDVMKSLGKGPYVDGTFGETLLLEKLDVPDLSVGDVLLFGTVDKTGEVDGVIARVTGPRFPCINVAYSSHAPEVLMALLTQPVGAYFEILSPGEIEANCPVRRIGRAELRMMLPDMFAAVLKTSLVTKEMLAVADNIPGFPDEFREKWHAIIDAGKSAALGR